MSKKDPNGPFETFDKHAKMSQNNLEMISSRSCSSSPSSSPHSPSTLKVNCKTKESDELNISKSRKTLKKSDALLETPVQTHSPHSKSEPLKNPTSNASSGIDWKITMLDGTQTVELNVADEMGKQKKTHVCLFCGKIYNRKYGLKIHLRTHTGYKPLKCKVCSRPFSDPSNLNKHVRLHSQGDTPYRCPYCSKILVRKRDLDRHVISRHSGKEMCEEISTSPCSPAPLSKSESPLHSSLLSKNISDTTDESDNNNNSMSEEEPDDEEISNEEYNSQFEMNKSINVCNKRDFVCESPNSEITI